jgi:hypothetical protein
MRMIFDGRRNSPERRKDLFERSNHHKIRSVISIIMSYNTFKYTIFQIPDSIL